VCTALSLELCANDLGSGEGDSKDNVVGAAGKKEGVKDQNEIGRRKAVKPSGGLRNMATKLK
jgi:hypothetical protein